MKKVNLYEAKTQLSKLVQEVEQGAEIYIARMGKPVARLVPLEKSESKRQLGAFGKKIKIAENFDEPLPDEIAAAFGAK